MLAAMNPAERKFLKHLKESESELLAATPGLVIQVIKGGRLKMDIEFGHTYPYYDLASLTKIIFTATAVGRAMDQGLIKPDATVADYWPSFRHGKIRISELLTHSAGLPWWRPLFKELKGPMRHEPRWSQLCRRLERVPRKKSAKSVYSDIDLFVLGKILTEQFKKSLPQIWREMSDPKIFGQMDFHIGNRPLHAKKLYAPTEQCLWRRRILQGEVHDENAWALSGVAPHAGLFGRIQDVSRWALQARSTLKGVNESLMGTERMKQMTQRRIPRTKGDWGYLFMKPSSQKPSAGRYFSKQSFGHTGFTGTSLWIDPRQDLIVIILSNRVHPTRANARFLPWRGRLHNWIVESLD
jgi:serine-type D-Ala-D-Ala carboxypeptidase